MVNRVILLGRVGKDPEVKVLSTDKKVASFSLATTEKYKDKNGEKKEVSEWHTVVFFGPLANVIETYVKKGTLLHVEGKIKTESYDKDGVKMYRTKIIGSSMNMLGGKPGEKEAVPEAEYVADKGDDMDDLPF